MINVRKIPERLLAKWFVPRQDYAETLGALKAVNKALDEAERKKVAMKTLVEFMKTTGERLTAERNAAENERRLWRMRCEGYEDCLADIGLEFWEEGEKQLAAGQTGGPEGADQRCVHRGKLSCTRHYK